MGRGQLSFNTPPPFVWSKCSPFHQEFRYGTATSTTTGGGPFIYPGSPISWWPQWQSHWFHESEEAAAEGGGARQRTPGTRHKDSKQSPHPCPLTQEVFGVQLNTTTSATVKARVGLEE
uniref:Uncharacterized protein n=1 Tax=Eutreptiella gymnastica TaxID=73025 RepID=A0A7S4FDH1_9EUGL|mmetsp:Transcript_15120/g.24244  ORF Transcript_15120/g.24244 Transcript_15120/m.24244 type:complete len:119 (+) Transcript_15120:16-372(+)